jgi:hypothetical protein
MRKRKNILYSITAVAMLALVGTTGCKKFLDVNANLNSPTAVPLSLLLSGAERSLGNQVALGSTLGAVASVYVHQTTGRVGADRYGGSADAAWTGLFNTITNLNVIITRGVEEKRFVYVGVAKILKAYAYSVLVDVWGDAPFTEQDRFTEGILAPKFDKGNTIYPKLFTLLDEGVADMNNATVNPSKPTTDDYIYKGSIVNWTKAANTIKLKLYTQVRLVQDVKAQVAALLGTPASLINAQNESFILPYGPNGATDDRHPAYGDYNATQRGGQLFSPWLYEIMKGKNTDILNGISDPRINYYIYNQKLPGAAPENCTEYRDGGFVTIWFGSNGNCRDGSNTATYSLLGLYPAGGRFEDASGKSITQVGGGAVAGTGALPHAFISYADRLYLEAELKQTGVVTTGTAARASLGDAIDASFNQMEYFITTYIKPGSAGAPQVVPSIASTTAGAVAYKASVLAAYDASSAAKQLEYIMTEKWINRIENPVDSYTDYRRTNYPVMFSPAPVGTISSVTAPDGKVTPVSNDKKYPLSLPFNLNEIALNPNAPPQKIAEAFKVFWMP